MFRPSLGGSGDHLSSAGVLPSRGSKAIVLFEHDHYNGRMLTLYGSLNEFTLFNDRVSSIIVIGGTWKIYEHRVYRGRSQTLNSSEYLTGFDIGDNGLSSVQLLD